MNREQLEMYFALLPLVILLLMFLPDIWRKLTHWYFAFLRAVGLRKKAQMTAEMSKDGKSIMFHIDKLDPGESVEFKGPIILGSKKSQKKGSEK